MHNYFREIDLLIRNNRENLNSLDEKLASQLDKISLQAKEFIIAFCENWDECIREKGLLFDYAKTAELIKAMLEKYGVLPGFGSTAICSDFLHFLDVQAREKDNDWHKSKAQGQILNDIQVLHYCFVQWCEE